MLTERSTSLTPTPRKLVQRGGAAVAIGHVAKSKTFVQVAFVGS
jgi:hypothetical protein